MAKAVSGTYGGLSTIKPPAHFPPRGLMVTSLDNLSIYYQDTSVRRSVADNPKRKRVEDLSSANEGYVIEDETKAAMFEPANVKLPGPGSTWV